MTTISGLAETLNILLFRAQECAVADGGELQLTGRRLLHLRQVLQVAPGSTLRVGEINGRLGTGRIRAIDSGRAVIEVALDRLPPAKLPLAIVLALPRPKMLRRILRAVAETGVRELHLINSYRVEKSFWQSDLLHPENLESYLLQGLEQAGDTMLPKVTLHKRFRPFAEDVLPQLAAGRRALLAHPGAYPPCPGGNDRETLLAIGPEGGYTPFEVSLLQAASCAPVSLGDRTLRVETAIQCAVGRFLTQPVAGVSGDRALS